MPVKKFTTSAQKTLSLPKDVILKKLEDEMAKDAELVFTKTNSNDIRKAKLKDGSTIVIAGFDKENGKTLAMIDHKNLPGNLERQTVQTNLKNKLEKIFHKQD